MSKSIKYAMLMLAAFLFANMLLTGVSALGGFDISKDKIGLSIEQGSMVKEEIFVRNIGESRISVKIESKELDMIGISIAPSSLSVEPGELGKVSIVFSAERELAPGLYTGKIIVSGGWNKKEIEVNIEVQKSESLLSNYLTIRPDFSEVAPGEDMFVEIKLSSSEKIDVKDEYYIKGDGGDIKVSEDVVYGLEGDRTFSKRIEIPGKISSGKHVLYVKSKYNDKEVVSSAEFVVRKKISLDSEKVLNWGAIGLMIAVIIGLIYLLIRIRRLSKEKQ